MLFDLELTINLTRKRVIELFDSVENLKERQEGLQSFTHKSGTPGQEAAQSDIVYQMGKRRIEMVETITKLILRDEFSGTYETNSMWNLAENFFIDQDVNTTLWRTSNTFKCKTFMLKIMTFLMPGVFKKSRY